MAKFPNPVVKEIISSKTLSYHIRNDHEKGQFFGLFISHCIVDGIKISKSFGFAIGPVWEGEYFNIYE